MSAVQRLESILWQGSISAFVTYSQGDPAVCLTETKLDGLNFLIRDRGYEPWALLFQRQKVYDAGGGPVWYTRPSEYEALRQLDPKLRSWVVRLDPGSDWLEEREWRVPQAHRPDGQAPAISLTDLGFIGLIVADLNWDCGQHFPFGTSHGQPAGRNLPPILKEMPRFWWNPTEQRLVQVDPLLH
ncbi:hypothetical protein ACWEO2_39830 [Nocardia sp. NPDC004278]